MCSMRPIKQPAPFEQNGPDYTVNAYNLVLAPACGFLYNVQRCLNIAPEQGRL